MGRKDNKVGPVRNCSPVPKTWEERCGRDGNVGLMTQAGVEPGRPGQLAAGATDAERDQKLEESPIPSEKCLSQETGEPLGPVSHGRGCKNRSGLCSTCRLKKKKLIIHPTMEPLLFWGTVTPP